MIHEVTMFACKCDNCDEDWVGYDDIFCMLFKSDIENDLNDSDWHTLKVDGQQDKHYCPECHSFNENDELIIKSKI